MITMVDHQFCHTAVDADGLAGDESGFLRAEIERHVRNVDRLADPAAWLLYRIRAGIICAGCVDPAGRD